MKNSSFWYLLFFSCFIIAGFFAYAQTQENLVNRESHYIKSKKLVGKWKSANSLRNTIEFIDSSYQFVMLDSGSHPYYFFVDSLENVFSSGYFPNWPPYNCDLDLISNDSLNVTFSVMGEGESYLYIRKGK